MCQSETRRGNIDVSLCLEESFPASFFALEQNVNAYSSTVKQKGAVYTSREFLMNQSIP